MTSLQQFVAMEGVDDRLAETRVWGVLLNLLRAVKHLHDSDLIHFDIKLVSSIVQSYAEVKTEKDKVEVVPSLDAIYCPRQNYKVFKGGCQLSDVPSFSSFFSRWGNF